MWRSGTFQSCGRLRSWEAADLWLCLSANVCIYVCVYKGDGGHPTSRWTWIQPGLCCSCRVVASTFWLWSCCQIREESQVQPGGHRQTLSLIRVYLYGSVYHVCMCPHKVLCFRNWTVVLFSLFRITVDLNTWYNILISHFDFWIVWILTSFCYFLSQVKKKKHTQMLWDSVVGWYCWSFLEANQIHREDVWTATTGVCLEKAMMRLNSNSKWFSAIINVIGYTCVSQQWSAATDIFQHRLKIIKWFK